MTLLQWLEKCGMTEVKPVVVKIGKEEYQAASYRDPRFDSEERIYAIGDVSHWKHYHYDDGQGKVWYIGAYSPEVIKPEFAEYHPFGHSFILMIGKPGEFWFDYGPRGGKVPVRKITIE